MKKKKNTITDFYVPGVSSELKLCFQKVPIPTAVLEFSVASNNEMINQISKVSSMDEYEMKTI